MHILEINDFKGSYGGAERHFMSLCALLEHKGHRISCFHSMEHYKKGGIRAVRKAFEALLDSDSFDIAHIHVLDHKFLFILEILASHSITIIQTLHDHRAICFNTAMYCRGRICEKCRGNKYYWANINGCIHLLMALRAYIFRGILKRSDYDRVSLFISPSDFLIEKFREWGFRGEIEKLTHFLTIGDYTPCHEESSDSILFFGRLSSIKGIHTLISAVKGLSLHLKVAGAGEMKDELEKRIGSERLENISLLGYREGDELLGEIGSSLFVVVPSECYENAPYAVTEAFAMGKPVVGSNRGGISELIGNEERGILFSPGDPKDLRSKILRLWEDREMTTRLGRAARAYAEQHFCAELYYSRFMEILARAMAKGTVK